MVVWLLVRIWRCVSIAIMEIVLYERPSDMSSVSMPSANSLSLSIISSGLSVSFFRVPILEICCASFSSTSESSTPRAVSCNSFARFWPNAFSRACVSNCASSLDVFIPNSSKISAVLGPTPKSLEAGIFSKNLFTSESFTSVRPSGFCFLEAIFATSLFGPIPTEHVRLSFS